MSSERYPYHVPHMKPDTEAEVDKHNGYREAKLANKDVH